MSQNTSNNAPSLAHKLATMIHDLDIYVRQGGRPDFGTLRSMLGAHHILLLPNIKDHHEVSVPSKTHGACELMRTTVTLEVQLIDGDSNEQLRSRWIGRALDTPEQCYDQAITQALKDFFKKTFLLLDFLGPESTHLSAPVHTTHEQKSIIKRRPQGSSAKSVKSTPNPQLELIHEIFPDEVRELQGEAQIVPKHMTDEVAFRAWKAANAQWRVLVSRAVPTEVMALYEDALEQRFGVDSWRKVTPSQIREVVLILRRRSEVPSDIRRMSDREEYILSHIAHVPECSSLDRLNAELERLVLATTSKEVFDSFLKVYLKKMNVESLSQVPGRAVIALTRKLRKLQPSQRHAFVHHAIGLLEHGAA